jgi:hypothetical protein
MRRSMAGRHKRRATQPRFAGGPARVPAAIGLLQPGQAPVCSFWILTAREPHRPYKSSAASTEKIGSIRSPQQPGGRADDISTSDIQRERGSARALAGLAAI